MPLTFPPLKFAQKGFILVAFPLLFEILFVVLLASLLKQADMTALQEKHLSDVIGETEQLKSLFTSAALVLLTDSAQKDAHAGEKYDELVRKISEQIRLLDRLVAGTPEQQEIIRQLDAISNEGLEKLEHLARMKAKLDRQQNVSILLMAREVRSDLGMIANRFVPELDRLNDIERREILKAGPEAEVRSRMMVQFCLAGGVLVNIILAILLVIYFNRGTTRRLKIIMDNTGRLARNASLNPALEGNDELGHLDRTFHKMAQDLAEANRKERAVVDNAVDVICSINEAGKFTAVNPAALKAWGYQPAELLNRVYTDILEAVDVEGTIERVKEIITSKSTASFECRIKHKNGTLNDSSWSAHWSQTEKALFCVIHDITEQKQIERMKQDFVSMLSHDLRSPLTSVEGTLSLACAGAYGQLPDKLALSLERAERNAQRIIGLITDLLDIEKMESGMMKLNRADVSLSEILTRSLESVHTLAEQKEITLKVSHTNLDVYADFDLLIRVVVNLLSNAIKFSPAGGEIQITISDPDGFVEVRVSDQGAGIPESDREAVFDRFRQVEGTKKGGSGLGLAICKAVIEQHGGKIGVESQLDRGSTFWFRIPA